MFGTRSAPRLLSLTLKRLLSLTLKRLVSLTLKRLLSLTLKALNSAAQGTARVQPARGRYPGADSYHVRFTPKALHIGTERGRRRRCVTPSA
jgi:hypothetical protein